MRIGDLESALQWLFWAWRMSFPAKKTPFLVRVCVRESFGVVVVAKRSQPRLPFYEGKERGASEEPRWENSSRLGGM